MALAKSTLTPRVSKEAASRFMAQLMLPVLDADLQDKGLARDEAKVAREARKRIEANFYAVWREYMAAHHLALAMSYAKAGDDDGRGGDAYKHADTARRRAMDRAMKTPAGVIRHLRWKQERLRDAKKYSRYGVDLAAWKNPSPPTKPDLRRNPPDPSRQREPQTAPSGAVYAFPAQSRSPVSPRWADQ